MSANEVDASVRPDPVQRVRGGIRNLADRWPFRRKLNVLVGVPLVVVAALLAYVIAGLVDQAHDAGKAAQLVRDSRQVAELVDRIQSEHQQAVLLSVRFESTTGGIRPSPAAFHAAQAATEAQADKVRAAFGSRIPLAEAQVLKEIDGLGSLRATIEESGLPADNIDPAYTTTVDALIDGLGLDRGTDLDSRRIGSQLDSLLRAEAAHASFETCVFSAQTGDSNALIEFINAVGSEQLYTYQAGRFGRFATDAQRARLAGIEQSPAWNAIALQYAGLQIDPSSLEAKTPAQLRPALDSALRAYPGYQQQAQDRLRITNDLIGQIASEADRTSDQTWWRAAWLLGGALLDFVLWLGFSVAIRRSVLRPVQALTGAAVEVAEVAGQELARVADDDAVDVGPPRLREVPVSVRDEIGDLADAFNRVQTTAAALLERQVLSRRNVAEMFGNVGRRVSNLTARQLALIDAIERGETDPELLDRLYRIDHLAVRLQRNADSLMLLAGIRETGLDNGPTALTNVVRAALGQIEGYQRVSLVADTEVTVAPDIIADLTLMLAELLENAVAFSPARSPVEVSVRSGAEGALIEICDHGLGMSGARLAEENARLIRRERLDLVPTKVLGLFVVGSLARRWGVGVTLIPTPGGGVTVRVGIPSSLLLLMSPFTRPAQDADATAGRKAAGEPSAAADGTADPKADPRADARAEAWAEARAKAEADTEAQAARRDPPDAGPAPLPERRRPVLPAARTAEAASGSEVEPAHGSAAEPVGDSAAAPVGAPGAGGRAPAARPLRRRVRGATLRTSDDDTAAQEARQSARPELDAEEVRSELDEFEAAVERAHRDTAASNEAGNPKPKGVEQ